MVHIHQLLGWYLKNTVVLAQVVRMQSLGLLDASHVRLGRISPTRSHQVVCYALLVNIQAIHMRLPMQLVHFALRGVTARAAVQHVYHVLKEVSPTWELHHAILLVLLVMVCYLDYLQCQHLSIVVAYAILVTTMLGHRYFALDVRRAHTHNRKLPHAYHHVQREMALRLHHLQTRMMKIPADNVLLDTTIQVRAYTVRAAL